jgi:outer membrane protein OmpA-like peptidoglycan-associated protein
MRTSVIVGILGLALTAFAITEWASRRPVHQPVANATDAARPAPRDAGDGSSVAPQPVPGVPTPAADLAEKVDDGATVVLVVPGFRANAQSLSEAMIDAIDAVFTGPDAADLLCGRFLIVGHSDNLGTPEVNQRVGLSRALAVRRYLSDRYEIPLDAMRVASDGGGQPVGDNATPEGRALNRRVVITRIAHAH